MSQTQLDIHYESQYALAGSWIERLKLRINYLYEKFLLKIEDYEGYNNFTDYSDYNRQFAVEEIHNRDYSEVEEVSHYQEEHEYQEETREVSLASLEDEVRILNDENTSLYLEVRTLRARNSALRKQIKNLKEGTTSTKKSSKKKSSKKKAFKKRTSRKKNIILIKEKEEFF